jgi:hypothetical protein
VERDLNLINYENSTSTKKTRRDQGDLRNLRNATAQVTSPGIIDEEVKGFMEVLFEDIKPTTTRST